jgi:hypothetical protein
MARVVLGELAAPLVFLCARRAHRPVAPAVQHRQANLAGRFTIRPAIGYLCVGPRGPGLIVRYVRGAAWWSRARRPLD